MALRLALFASAAATATVAKPTTAKSSSSSSSSSPPHFSQGDFAPTNEPNMNGDFVISTTPGATPGLFPKQYKDYPGGVEFYDVLSPPITTLYSQVWWAPLAPVDFPAEMVQKYAGKDMAIVGWEIDQVRVLPDGTQQSVPISATYNHHYNAQIIGANAKFKKVYLTGPDDPHAAELLKASHGMLNYDQPHYVPQERFDAKQQNSKSAAVGANSIFVTSANGGEYRKSFHGYAPGHANVIHSPTQLQVSPMQIDTWNRAEMDISSPVPPPFVAGPLPRAAEAPPGAEYSGLLECPMTTRLSKVIDGEYAVQAHGAACAGAGTEPILTFQECYRAAASALGGGGASASGLSFRNSTGADATRPLGCSVSADAAAASGTVVDVFFNSLANSTVECGAGSPRLVGGARSLLNVSVALDLSLIHI